jgi:hypothetical protein
MVRHVVWDVHRDFVLARQQTGPLEPTLQLNDANLRSSVLLSLMRELEPINLPVLKTTAYEGWDGAAFGLQVHLGHYTNMRCQWWCDGPPEWASLTNWAKQMIAKLTIA